MKDTNQPRPMDELPSDRSWLEDLQRGSEQAFRSNERRIERALGALPSHTSTSPRRLFVRFPIRFAAAALLIVTGILFLERLDPAAPRAPNTNHAATSSPTDWLFALDDQSFGPTFQKPLEFEPATYTIARLSAREGSRILFLQGE